MRGPDRIAESLHHSRPRTFYSEIEENPDFDPHEWGNSNNKATHVLNGYLGPKLAGQIHFSQSDDGKALSVENMHTEEGTQGHGVGSAMMDDLYRHALENRAWVNHGVRTAAGNSWWSNYREPHPEMNTHHAHPYSGWMKYWSVPDVAGEAEYNYQNSGGRGAHTQPPAYDPDEFPGRDRSDRWTHALGMTPARRATAMLMAAGEEPGEIIALAQLAGFTADLSPSDAMIWRHLDTAHEGGHESARGMGIDPHRYHDVLHEQRAAVAIPHSHDAPGAPPPGSWRPAEAALTITADQANAPWGSSNVAQHPPGKPYGATQPPDKDKSPGSYGPLSGPDPENWGGIQEDSIFQSPLTNEASVRPVPGDVHWPDMNGWQAASQEDQESYPYSDRANTGGPSTSISPRDPQGIRMEEGLAELKDEPEAALPSTTGEDDIETTAVRGRPQPYGDVRDRFRTIADSAMGTNSAAEGLTDQEQDPSVVNQEPGIGSMDDAMSPGDPSIQTIGQQQWSGGGGDSDEITAEPGDAQGDMSDIVASFQRSAAARQFGEVASDHAAGGQLADGDIAAAARQFLKTADVLPDKEAAELIAEGRGQRARNLGLLRLEGTHYEELSDEQGDQVEDDLAWA